MTITARAMVGISVNCVIDRRADGLGAIAGRGTLMAGGKAAVKRGNWAMMASTVSMTLAPGCLKMIRKTPRLPLAQACCLASSGPATAWPMSRTRKGAPLR